jgi:hypothetical protein
MWDAVRRYSGTLRDKTAENFRAARNPEEASGMQFLRQPGFLTRR